MATSDEVTKLWALAGKLAEARKNNAKAQKDALKRQKHAEKMRNQNNWFGPTLTGAASGALTGMMAGGPMGALAGGAIGAGVGYVGHEKFNENPEVLPMLGNTAIAGAGIYNRHQALAKKGPQPGQDLGEFNNVAARGLSLTPGLQQPGTSASQYDLPMPELAPIPTSDMTVEGLDFSGQGNNRLGFPLETSSFDDLDAAANEFQQLNGPQGSAASPLDYRFNTEQFAPFSSDPDQQYGSLEEARIGNNFADTMGTANFRTAPTGGRRLGAQPLDFAGDRGQGYPGPKKKKTRGT